VAWWKDSRTCPCGYGRDGTRWSMPANSPKPERGRLLDLAQFESLDQAIDRAERVGGKYAEVGEFVLRQPRLTLTTLFFVSALARAQGLHDAIVREIRHGNPHAVFTLMRAYAETAAIILYVKDHPNYVSVVQTAPEELPNTPAVDRYLAAQRAW
jgi:hypothetical protein